jgi:hypothetical protein
MLGSDTPIRLDAETLAARFADPAVRAHLARGNRDFSDYRSFFSATPLAWTPSTQRAEAPLTDVFPRDEFYLNNEIRATSNLRSTRDLLAQELRR